MSAGATTQDVLCARDKIRRKQAESKRCRMAAERRGLLWTAKWHLTCDDAALST
jgi:hypothetical protein